MSLAIRTENLHKIYPGDSAAAALRSLTIAVGAGELVAVLGPNGAGKTTLFKILATLVQPTGGEAWVAGHALRDSRAVRRCIGMVSDPDRSFFWRLDARQNLQFFAAGYGLHGPACDRRIAELVELLGLSEAMGKPVGRLSSGQRGRLALARALLHRPTILLLDEPTRSLDPTAAADFLRLLQRYRDETPGASILLASHRLGAIAPFCQRALILKQGELVADGAVPDLLVAAGLITGASPAENLACVYEHFAGKDGAHAH